jgi:hypothetical protein
MHTHIFLFLKDLSLETESKPTIESLGSWEEWEGNCCSLDLQHMPKTHVIKAWIPACGAVGGDGNLKREGKSGRF